MAQSIWSHYPPLLDGEGLLLSRARSLVGIGMNGLFIGHPPLISFAKLLFQEKLLSHQRAAAGALTSSTKESCCSKMDVWFDGDGFEALGMMHG